MLSLLSFDLVMTLSRPYDIDLLISSLLGWPARNFSSQPAGRVRDVASVMTLGEEHLEFLGRRLQADNSWPISSGGHTLQPMHNEGLEPAAAPNSIFATNAGFSSTRMMLAVSSADSASGNQDEASDSDDEEEPDDNGRRRAKRDTLAEGLLADVEEDDDDGVDNESDESSDELFDAAAAALDKPLEDQLSRS